MKISVITAVFNRADSITDAVRSVQAQSWHNVEHVVVDGASTDGTMPVLQACLNALRGPATWPPASASPTRVFTTP